MSNAPHKPVLVIIKAKLADANAIFLKHLGGPVAWQEIHGKGASNTAPATHYMLEADADEHLKVVMRIVTDTLPAANMSSTMKGRRTKAQLRARGEGILDGMNLKKKPQAVEV